MATGLGPLKEDVAHGKDMEDDDKQTKGKRLFSLLFHFENQPFNLAAAASAMTTFHRLTAPHTRSATQQKCVYANGPSSNSHDLQITSREEDKATISMLPRPIDK